MNPVEVLEAGWGFTDAKLQPLGAGHINDTLLAEVDGRPAVVLQRINEQVFTDPGRVMSNLARVQAHLGEVAPGLIPALIEALDGQCFFKDNAGAWWRLWEYLPDGRTIEQTRDPAICRAAAHTFGRFQRLLDDLPGPTLEPTIPGFLELAGYLERFDGVVAATSGAEAVIDEVCGRALIENHRDLAMELPRGGTVIHGDCKLNNLLFAQRGSAVRAVLDLDTIMVGHWAWDFGDLARSVLTGAAEGEPGQTGAGAQDALDLFAALVKGFLAGRKEDLDARALAVAPVYVAFMLGVRFLTDHLEGDRYFKISKAGENLDRARRQFDLIKGLPIASFEAVASEILANQAFAS